MSEIQTVYPSGLFHCKRCGQSQFMQEHIDRTNTGVNVTELTCNVCQEEYRIRWTQDRPQMPVLSGRKQLCVDDKGHGYMANWNGADHPEAANGHLPDGRNATVFKRLADRAKIV